jgi:hypothetical protein
VAAVSDLDVERRVRSAHGAGHPAPYLSVEVDVVSAGRKHDRRRRHHSCGRARTSRGGGTGVVCPRNLSRTAVSNPRAAARDPLDCE